MLIRNFDDVAANPVNMPDAESVSMKLLLGRDHGAPNFAMRMFEVQPGGHTPHHSHNYEHEVIIIEGTAEVMGGLNGAVPHQVSQGDVLLVPPNEVHQFRNTGQTTLRFICLIPNQYDVGQGQYQPTPGS